MDNTQDNKARTLEAARKLLFENGYGGTTSVAVAREAGTSKATIYRHFGNMDGLLQRVIEIEVERFQPPQAQDIVDFNSFRAAMVGFGTNLLTFLNNPETIHFSRMLSEQARQQPKATKLYFEAAYQGTADSFESMIEIGAPYCRSVALPEDARAERYVALLKGHRYESAVLGLESAPYPNPKQTSIACFNAVFIESSAKDKSRKT
jgi:TetR/AcrR family transcriptional regulator, mexJK operon transcriptional repressor